MTAISAATQARCVIPRSARRTGPVRLARAAFASRIPVSLRNPVNIGLIAELAAERYGRVPVYLDQPFAWDPAQRVELDYVEVADLVREMSAALAQAGVGRRDRVVILKSPNYDIQVLAWAAARIGAIPALLSARLDPDILGVLLERLGPRFIITDPEVARHARLDPGRLKALSCTAIAPIKGGIPVADLWGGPVPAPAPLDDDEPMLITHTSSTTGISKLGETCARAVSYTAWFESVVPMVHAPDELFASAISHVHIRAATTQLATFSRGTPVLGIGSPDDATVLSMFSRYRPTIAETHPNAFLAWERLADHPSEPFASVRLFFSTFDAIHPRTVRKLLGASKRRFPLWVQSYGMTETQVVTCQVQLKRPIVPGRGDTRSVGVPAPGVRVRIADPDTGKRLRNQRDIGMIQVSTPARVLSFVGTPDKFAARKHGKWFDTGDFGRRGRWGQVEVLDRVADHIDGVESCLKIEDVLLDRIPDAEEIVVVPDEHGNPVPAVLMRDGMPLDPEVWRAASAGLAGLGDPFEVNPEDLRRTATNKARRYLLSELIKTSRAGRPQTIGTDVMLREGA